MLAADLILHVRDVSHPDSEEQKRDVEAVLDELGIGAEARAARLIEVWNKSDLLPAEEIAALQAAVARESGATLISAIHGTGIATLLETVDRRLAAGREVVELDLDYGAGEAIAWLHRHGSVIETRDDGERLHLKVTLSTPQRAQLGRILDRVV